MLPRRLPAPTVVALAALLAAGCHPKERTARAHLEAEGLTELELVSVSGTEGSFAYSGRRDADHCVGEISVAQGHGSTRIDDKISCQPAVADCSMESPEVCFRLGLIAHHGDDDPMNPSPIDPARAAGFFDVGCSAGHGPSCNALGLAYAEGAGVPADELRAERAFERSCAGQHPKGCYNLAVALHHHPERRDLPRALALYDRACRGGVAKACYNLDGDGMSPTPHRAATAFDASCQGGHLQGCVNLGVMLVEDNGLPPDPTRARRLFAHACAGGLDEGCRGRDRLK
ncbi:MAG: tetratricopeptide repeat protein [Polyangiaceae bacterium]